jgi:hypothetical protein
MARKTIPVEAVKAAANRMLAQSDDTMQQGRIGVYMLLERVLFDTDNYRGYRYVSPEDGDNIAGQLDDTRRFYH